MGDAMSVNRLLTSKCMDRARGTCEKGQKSGLAELHGTKHAQQSINGGPIPESDLEIGCWKLITSELRNSQNFSLSFENKDTWVLRALSGCNTQPDRRQVL